MKQTFAERHPYEILDAAGKRDQRRFTNIACAAKTVAFEQTGGMVVDERGGVFDFGECWNIAIQFGFVPDAEEEGEAA